MELCSQGVSVKQPTRDAAHGNDWGGGCVRGHACTPCSNSTAPKLACQSPQSVAAGTKTCQLNTGEDAIVAPSADSESRACFLPWLKRRSQSFRPSHLLLSTFPSPRFQVRGQEVLSFSVLEHVVGAGSTGEMVFWDRRTAGGGGYGKVLGRLDDTHAEDVTQVGVTAGRQSRRGGNQRAYGEQAGWGRNEVWGPQLHSNSSD